MNNIFLFILIALFGSNYLIGQNLNDAMRMSDLNIGSTARSAGVAGSMTAIGGDYSVLSMNPAGLATYRSGQVMVSLGYIRVQSESNLLGSTNRATDDQLGRVNINNAGIVWSKRPEQLYEDHDGEYYNVSRWKTSNFTIGFNRLANLNANYTFQGTTNGSLGDHFLYTASDGDRASDLFGDVLAEDVNFLNEIEFEGYNYLRHEAEKIDTVGLDLAFSQFAINKLQIIERRGSINELIFGWAGNYNEKFLIGANVGIPIVWYSEEKSYLEMDLDDEIPVFDNLQYTENLDISGAGFNVKIGGIYMPHRNIRIGAAIHSPTFYQLDDEYTTSFTYERIPNNGGFPSTANSPQGEIQYRIQTPWKFSHSFAYIFGRYGFISADIEYLNYGGTSFNLDIDFEDPDNDLLEEDLNAEIDEIAQSAFNIRLGGELAIKGMRLRAGYGLIGQQLNLDLPRRTLMSVGLGHAFNSFYIDIAAQRLTNDIQYSPYANPDTRQDVDISQSQYRGLLTFGVKI